MLARFIRAFVALAALGFVPHAAAFGLFPPRSSVTVVEYLNEITGHYVLLADLTEIAAVDNGAAGPGWRKTGHRFGQTWEGSWFPPADVPEVCRFYSPSNNSHFFTANPAECEYLRTNDTGWMYEKVAFHLTTPVGGACAPGSTPIHRLFNNRHMLSDANHRYTASSATRATLIAAGWIDEGIAFCPDRAWQEADRRFAFDAFYSGFAIFTLQGCGESPGTCVAVGQLPTMPTFIEPFVPPRYLTANPDFPIAGIRALTGAEYVPIRTSLPAGSTQLLQRSFLQAGRYGGLPMGLHINGRDRLGGSLASMAPMHLPIEQVGQSQHRPRPWPYRGESALVLTADVSVKKVARETADAHAYGVPILHFGDRRSGQSFLVTLQAFGTVPPGDFIAPDANLRIPIVSTSFRADPAFGRRLAGDFVRCDPAAAAACVPQRTRFQFAIGKGDFARVLQMARTVDGALSADPNDYELISFRFHAETYLDASLAMTLHDLSVELWP